MFVQMNEIFAQIGFAELPVSVAHKLRKLPQINAVSAERMSGEIALILPKIEIMSN